MPTRARLPRCVSAALLPSVIALGLASPARAADNAPEWLTRAAKATVAADVKDERAVVLLDENAIVVGNDGTATETRRCAIKILSPDGRGRAFATHHYLAGTGKVLELNAWVIRPSGMVKEFGKSDAIDMAVVDNDVYNESRIRSIFATREVEPGSVFGYECRAEDRHLLKEFEWHFQDALATARSRVSVAVPDGWTLRAVTFNHEEITPTKTGRETIWELTQLSPVPDEPRRPPLTSIVPRLAVSVVPPTGGANSHARAFESWDALAVWLCDLTEPQATQTDAVRSRAIALTSAATNDADRIRAIGSFVQSINYISIQLGVGRGGGYRPHSAHEVVTKGYGDCKDKANLMRSMVGAVGIPAYLALVYFGDRSYVRESWPAVQQFNHCIVAVRAPEGAVGPVVDHPKLGKLLLFDPTDPATPLGDLPESEQGSLALIVTREPGAVVRLPVLPTGSNRVERRNEVVLAADGSIHAVVTELSTGQSGAAERRHYRSLAPPDYLERVETLVNSGAPQSRVSRVKPLDRRDEGAFELAFEFDAPKYSRLMDGRLLLFRPTVLDRWDSVALTDRERRLPVVLEHSEFRETSRFVLPTGFAVDELPDSVRLEAPFGVYASRIVAGDTAGELRMTRELTIRAATISPADYPSVRAFYERLREAERALVVLAKR